MKIFLKTVFFSEFLEFLKSKLMSSSANNVQSQYIRVLERLKDLVEENKRLKSTVESNEGETKVKIQKHTKTISDLERDLREYEARI